MGELYRFLSHIIVGMVAITFYFKLSSERKFGIKHIIVILIYALFMMLGHRVIIEPFRTMFGLLILATCLFEKEKRLALSGLLIPFLILPLLRTVIAFVIGFTTYLLFSESVGFEIVQLLIIFPVEAIIFTLLCKNIKTEQIKEALNEKEIKIIIYASTILMWLIYGMVHTLAALSTGATQAITLTLMSVLIPSGFVAISIIIYAVKKHHKISKLKKEISGLTSEKHYYKTVMIANDLTLKKFEEELNRVLKEKNIQDLGALARIFANFKKISTELGENFSLQELQTNIAGIELPNDWEGLRMILALFAYEARENNIQFSIFNHVENWQNICISETDLIRLIGNLISNSLKELKLTTVEEKNVQVVFDVDKEQVFKIEIFDNAHEFPIDVLKKLGQRNNSTNGTGEGYWEIFDILDMQNASFKLSELLIKDLPHKCIKVNFDHKGEISIFSFYRQSQLFSQIPSFKLASA